MLLELDASVAGMIQAIAAAGDEDGDGQADSVQGTLKLLASLQVSNKHCSIFGRQDQIQQQIRSCWLISQREHLLPGAETNFRLFGPFLVTYLKMVLQHQEQFHDIL
jgi:hypothetical protein